MSDRKKEITDLGLVELKSDTPCILCGDLGSDKWVNCTPDRGLIILCELCLTGMSLAVAESTSPEARQAVLFRYHALQDAQARGVAHANQSN